MTYLKLENHFHRLSHLHHIASISYWDEAVMMPPAAGPQRADAMATLHGVIHQMVSDPALPQWLLDAETEAESKNLNPWQQANVREMKRIVRRATCLPSSLVEALSRAQKLSEQEWRKLRPENDWDTFKPKLKEVVELTRETAAILGETLGCSPYEALLNDFEPGAKTDRIDRLFEHLKTQLPDLTEEITTRQMTEEVVVPAGPFAIERQKQLAQRLMQTLRYDFNRGRLDVSHHPFCGGNAVYDARITTRYDQGDFTKALMGTLHETGHAKYQQGLPKDWLGQPVGRSRSMSIHESQSLLHEMHVCRGRGFLTHSAPVVREVFAEHARQQPQAFTVDNLHRLYTRVRPSFIRVDADEVTYSLHIILRYEIEKKLFDGIIEVDDIPEAWDSGMKDLLGLSTQGNFVDGCMQDMHWPGGAFGYFPSYALGAMTAAQIMSAAQKELPNLDNEIGQGHFEKLDTWLSENIWQKGSLLSVDDLLREATGEELDPVYFLQHLQRRYLS